MLRPALFAALVLMAPSTAPARADVIRDRIYFPEPITAKTPRPPWPERTPQAVTVTTADGLTLAGYWWPPEPGREVILYFSGNAGNIETESRMAEPLSRGGRGLLVASWRGFGANPGKPNETGLYADADAFLARARELAPGARLIVFGYSLRAAVAIHTAATHPVDGLITLGAFTRLSDEAPVWARGLLPDRYDNLAAIKQVTAPIVIFHGTKDEVVPFALGEKLAAAVPQAKFGRLNGAPHRIDLTPLLPAVAKAVGEMQGAR